MKLASSVSTSTQISGEGMAPTLEWVPEVGHMLPLEQPEPVARALARWLDASV